MSRRKLLLWEIVANVKYFSEFQLWNSHRQLLLLFFFSEAETKKVILLFRGIMLYLWALKSAPVGFTHLQNRTLTSARKPLVTDPMHHHRRCWKSLVCGRPAVRRSRGLTFQGGLRVPIEPGQLKPDYCGHRSIWIQSGWQAAQGSSWPTWESVKAQNCFLIWLVWIFNPCYKRFTDWTFRPSKAPGHQQPPRLASTKLPVLWPLWGRHKLQLKKTCRLVAVRQALHQRVCEWGGWNLGWILPHCDFTTKLSTPVDAKINVIRLHRGDKGFELSYVKADVCDHSLL